MNKIQVLDCTLRDGGYCNEWYFGFDNAKKITSGLVEANIDIIECGFLTDKVRYNKEITRFNTIQQISTIIPKDKKEKLFVAMINYGEFDINNLPNYDGTSIDGIRVAFHKGNLVEALEMCEQIQDKGYKVFIQAMVSLSYSDEEFLSLIDRINVLKPEAFYIVDSFGMMKGKDLVRLFYMVEHNLNDNIWIGFHSHNNLQLAYSNAQQLVRIQTNRNLIIDSAIYGMGRGAGNLNTELFVDYLNENVGKNYVLRPLLVIIDEILNDFYQKNYWGYSLPNYLSAVYNTHPDYAKYLDDKKTLTVESMYNIFNMIEEDKKTSYDREYIENLYLAYMKTDRVRKEQKSELKNILLGKKVVLIAPGKSSTQERDKITAFLNNDNVVSICVNFNYVYAETNFIFLSNLRRFRELGKKWLGKCIVTSNIPAENVYLHTQYENLINDEESVKDNAGMMAIKFLIDYGVKEIYLAGFDGYSHDMDENYGESQMAFMTQNTILDKMNQGMQKMLKVYSQHANIVFLTKERNIVLDYNI